ncbi:MAG: NTP transferase domain-containing protein [Phycisphaerales bacterium]|nr:NTP transferase domain-containing protein [Phycisphaerales bacterium]
MVLAAGRGTRAGGPKALLHAGASLTPWWRVQAQRLTEIGVRPVWVVSGAVASEIGRYKDAPKHLVLSDADAPMFSSVLAGFRAVALSNSAGIFVLPVDTPAPAAKVWKALAGSSTPCVPEHKGKRGHPVFLPVQWVQRTLDSIHSAGIEPTELRLDTLIAATAVTVAVGDPAVCLNLNSAAAFLAYTP